MKWFKKKKVSKLLNNFKDKDIIEMVLDLMESLLKCTPRDTEDNINIRLKEINHKRIIHKREKKLKRILKDE